MAMASKTSGWSTADTLRLLASRTTENGDTVIDLAAMERTLASVDEGARRFLESAGHRVGSDAQPCNHRRLLDDNLFGEDDDLDDYVPRHLKKD
jgi:hypothetical protein